MLIQIFKKEIPIQLLYDLLEKICAKNDKYYMVDLNAYKKMLFHGYHTEFLNILVGYYHSSKRYYAERELTFNAFTTIIRQICKSNTVQFTSQIKYNSSKYNIEYLIYV
jgi:hypothetical protein